MAAREHIRVHTVIISRFASKAREAETRHLMAQVAEQTGGLYFRVTNLNSMMDVYRQIDRMEKSKFEQRRYRIYEEIYPWAALPAFALLLFTLIMRSTLWLRIP
jgi:Ca-activated chloride channel family protein